MHDIMLMTKHPFFSVQGCESSPCQNGGICSDDPGLQSYTCACPLGYGGLNCDTRSK